MGSPLGSVLADIFLTELEKTLLPDIYILYIKFWRRYVDDAISYVKIGPTKQILSLLNSFDENIQFTFEAESKCTLPFLDVLLCRNGAVHTTTVYRKNTNNDTYLNLNAFAPVSSKRAYFFCLFNRNLFKRRTYPSRKSFHRKKQFPRICY